MGKRSVNKTAEVRASMLRQGFHVPIPTPDPAPVWVVRYVRDNGDIVGKHFVREIGARKYAQRLRDYGKTPALFCTTTAVKWNRYS